MSKGYIVCVYESIKDNEALKIYADKARAAVEKYDGKFLVRGGKNLVTEGKNFVRTAVIEFNSFEKAKEFFEQIILTENKFWNTEFELGLRLAGEGPAALASRHDIVGPARSPRQRL